MNIYNRQNGNGYQPLTHPSSNKPKQDDIERRYYKDKKFSIYPSTNKPLFWTVEIELSSGGELIVIDNVGSYSKVNEIVDTYMYI